MKSCSSVAAAIAVISLTSYCGATSTTSIPTISNSPKDRIASRACAVLKPPETGVPVPGAKAGSKQSISKKSIPKQSFRNKKLGIVHISCHGQVDKDSTRHNTRHNNFLLLNKSSNVFLQSFVLGMFVYIFNSFLTFCKFNF